MYRGFPLEKIEEVVCHQMSWGWMLLSLLFGILPQVMRAWRWKQTLAPLGEHMRTGTAINAIFLSYASSLVIPRIGEITRCGTLAKYDKVSFSKALGTVVTERVVDSLTILTITGVTLLFQMPAFFKFFETTGTNIQELFNQFTTTGYIVTLICLFATILLAGILVWRLSIFSRVKGIVLNLWTGISSLRKVKNLPLYVFYSIGIWACYYLHFYLTFFCFDFTNNLGATDGLVMFCVGSFAVLVPTPNGAGPWHFAVKTLLILYGVGSEDAILFVLVVHTLQTALIVLLGLFSLIDLAWRKSLEKNKCQIETS